MGLVRRVRDLFRREKLTAELEEELEFHLAMREQLNAKQGMSQIEARRDARRRFGNVARLKEMMREIDLFILPETVWQDIRFAARMLMKHPGFSATAILVLGLGIGVNTALFTVYRAVLMLGIDADHPSEMMNVDRINYAGKFDPMFSYPDYQEFRNHVRSFSGLIAATVDEVALTGVDEGPSLGRSMGGALARMAGFNLPRLIGGGAEFVTTSIVSDNYFSVLGVGASRGRVFGADDTRYRDVPEVLISGNYWERKFRGDPAVIGKTVKLNGVAFTIVGITPKDFMGTNINVPDFWMPLRDQVLLHPGSTLLKDRENVCCRIFGRLAQGASVSEARAEMDLLAEHLRALHATHSDQSKPVSIQISPGSPFGRDLDSELKFAIVLMMCAVGMVLLIACANLAGLQLARSAARRKEIGVRASLGASRRRLFRQLLTECALLGLIAGGVSLPMTWGILHVTVVAISATLPAEWGAFALHVAPDMQIFAYVFAISLVAGVLFGLTPALESSKPDLVSALKEDGSHFALLIGRHRMRGIFITIQVAVCLVLMIAGGLLIRSSMRVLEMKTGYETKHVLFLDPYFPDGFGYSHERQVTEIRALRESIRSLPGVRNVTIGRPPDGGGFRTATVAVDGGKFVNQAEQGSVFYTYVQPDYFETLGMPMTLGVDFRPDRQGLETAVVSESAAKDFWPGRNPIGKKLVLDGSKQFHTAGEITPVGATYQVIGVVRDTRGVLLDGSDASKVYLLLPPDRLEDRPLLVRTEGDPRLLSDDISRLVRSEDSNMVVYSETLNQKLTDSPQFVFSRCSALFASILGALGLTLASVGIFGTVSYAVVRRTREVGIRMALGATRRDVVRMILTENTRPVLVGLLFGFIGAAVAAYLLRAILFGVSVLDPTSFLGVSAFFFAVAMLAAYVPARRATRVDPMVALRYE
jgi:macrolide transport system ATP-binding/permease protein